MWREREVIKLHNNLFLQDLGVEILNTNVPFDTLHLRPEDRQEVW